MKNFFLIIGCLLYSLGGLKAQEGVGDIHPIHSIGCVLTPTDIGRRGSESRGAYEAETVWEPGSTLRVRFLNGTSTQRGKVVEYAQQWEDYANIKFDFNSNAADAEIRINFDPNGNNSSFLGNVSLKHLEIPSMNYSFVDNTSEARIRRLVLHEFGHALGLHHEHQHPDSGIDWNVDAVIAGSRSEEFARFNILSPITGATTTGYDIQSVMHYTIPAEWTNNGFSVPMNTEISDGDKNTISEMYPFTEEACIMAENFESYIIGELIGIQSDNWIPYNGIDGSEQDVPIRGTSDGNKLLYIKGTNVNGGGPHDIVLELGDKQSGVYELEFYLFTNSGDKGYYNVLHQFLPQGGTEHASEVHFLGDNTGYLRLQNEKYDFTCYTGQWNKVVQRIDLDKDETTLFMNDNEVRTWQFSYKSYATEIGTKQLSAINFYPVDDTYDFFVDEIKFTQVAATVVEEDCACTNPNKEDICEDFDAYTTNQFLGVQSSCWIPWNGVTGSDQDVRPNNVSSDNNNLRIVGTAATGGPIDMTLALGDKTWGVYDLEFSINVPTGHQGYYNVLHEFTPGGNNTVYASEIYFNENGLGVLRVGGGVYPFAYQAGKWNKVLQCIDLDRDQTTLYIDGEKVRTWPFSAQSRNTKKAAVQLSAIDFYPVDSTYDFYIDDISLTKKSNVDGGNTETNKVFSAADSTPLTMNKQQKTLQVFPNPTNHLLNVSFDSFTEETLVIRLVNKMGQEVFQQKIRDRETLIQIDVSNFSEGTYLLNAIDSKGEMVSKKVVITN